MQNEVSRFNVQAQEVVASMVRQTSHRLIKSEKLIQSDIERQEGQLK